MSDFTFWAALEQTRKEAKQLHPSTIDDQTSCQQPKSESSSCSWFSFQRLFAALGDRDASQQPAVRKSNESAEGHNSQRPAANENAVARRSN